jgi:hypothetical protein
VVSPSYAISCLAPPVPLCASGYLTEACNAHHAHVTIRRMRRVNVAATGGETAKVNMVYPADLLKRIDSFWHKHQFKNRTAAVLWLLDWALSQGAKPRE